MSDTQQIVLSIISNYTTAQVGPKSKLADLKIGPLDAESIRFDLEDKFSITLGGSVASQWKKCKQLTVAVDRQLHKKPLHR